MTLEFDLTKVLIDQILKSARDKAYSILLFELEQINRTVPEFYEGVIKHGPTMPYTSDEWLDFHLKVPHWRLLDDKGLMDKLSEKQLEILAQAIR